MDLHKVKWQVSLSNGETFFEGKGPFREVEGEDSPWQKLDQYTAEVGATITSLSLYTDDGRTWNLPSAGKNPQFREFALHKPPFDYVCSRKVTRQMGKSGEMKISSWYTVAIAFYPDHQLQIWVDERNTRNSWVLVVKGGGYAQ